MQSIPFFPYFQCNRIYEKLVCYMFIRQLLVSPLLNAIIVSEETNASVQNANTITTSSASEQIDNAELQGNESKLDDNENDKENQSVETSPKNETMTTITSTITTLPVETDLNNGPFTNES